MAHDILVSQPRNAGFRVDSSNFLLKILAETGHVKDAMNMINSNLDSLDPGRGRSKDEGDRKPVPEYYLEVMKAIVKGVSECPDPTAQQSLSELCARMDSHAQMTEETVEESVFRPYHPSCVCIRGKEMGVVQIHY